MPSHGRPAHARGTPRRLFLDANRNQSAATVIAIVAAFIFPRNTGTLTGAANISETPMRRRLLTICKLLAAT